jgi:hypothetical protein
MSLFRTLRLRGPRATIVWGYRTAAVLRQWTVAFDRSEGPPRWHLTATIEHVDAFQLRQPRDLLFSTPRKGGFLCWPLLEAPQIANGRISVKLGPPEH